MSDPDRRVQMERAAVDRQTVRDLLERTVPLTVADLPNSGAGWRVYPALFTRAGATPAARTALEDAGGMLVDLARLYGDLAEPKIEDQG